MNLRMSLWLLFRYVVWLNLIYQMLLILRVLLCEHYYLHIDPSIEVLATTRFPVVNYYHISNKPVDMPVAWTKFWGNGRVFYTSLGHHDDVFDKSPNAQIIMERGMLWAGEGKQYAIDHNLTTERFENKAKMY